MVPLEDVGKDIRSFRAGARSGEEVEASVSKDSEAGVAVPVSSTSTAGATSRAAASRSVKVTRGKPNQQQSKQEVLFEVKAKRPRTPDDEGPAAQRVRADVPVVTQATRETARRVLVARLSMLHKHLELGFNALIALVNTKQPAPDASGDSAESLQYCWDSMEAAELPCLKGLVEDLAVDQVALMRADFLSSTRKISQRFQMAVAAHKDALRIKMASEDVKEDVKELGKCMSRIVGGGEAEHELQGWTNGATSGDEQ